MDNIRRIKAISASLEKAGLSAMLLLSLPNLKYAFGPDCPEGVAVITSAGHAFLMTDAIVFERAREALPDISVLNFSHVGCRHLINGLIGEYGIRDMGFEENSTTYSDYLYFQKGLHVPLVPAQALLSGLRAVKDTSEIERLSRACQIAEAAFEATLPYVQPGATEKDVSDRLIWHMLRLGADGISFPPMISSGHRTSFPHASTSNAKLARGLLMMDFGCTVEGYCSDLTRTVCLGPPSEEIKNAYSAVVRAKRAIASADLHNSAACVLDSIPRAILQRAYPLSPIEHALGHSIGLEVHEDPVIAPGEYSLLQSGNILCLEPSVYIKDTFGIRIEDMYVVDSQSARCLSGGGEELIILPFE